MTADQKEKITEMRSSGMGYGEIAHIVGLRTNTVKSYCRRKNKPTVTNHINPSEKPIVGICHECGQPVVQTEGRKEKKFCSDKCRMKWWNAHPEQVNHKIVRQITCPHCGKSFSVHGKVERKYCSHDCYIKDRFGGDGHDA